jgi:hypothetical protein
MIVDDMNDRRVPLALVAALLLQAGTAVWWAATKDSDDRFQQQRIASLEQEAARAQEAQTQTIERLARIEERVGEEMAVLDRIEKRLGQERR